MDPTISIRALRWRANAFTSAHADSSDRVDPSFDFAQGDAARVGASVGETQLAPFCGIHSATLFSLPPAATAKRFDVLGLAIQTAPNILGALRTFQRFSDYWDGSVRCGGPSVGPSSGVRIFLWPRPSGGDPAKAAAALMMWNLMELLRDSLGDQWSAQRLGLPVPMPPATPSMTGFAKELEFDISHAFLMIRETAAQRRLRNSHAGMHAHLCSELEAAEQVGQYRSFSAAVRQTLSSLPHEAPTAEAVADALHVSLRTLQRRLAGEGHSLRDVIDEGRAHWARHYLEAGHAPDRVAYQLGFSCRSTFNRACRRWFGMPPSEMAS